VTDGFRTRDNWSHNPVLYQLSYGHRTNAQPRTIAARPPLSRRTFATARSVGPEARREKRATAPAAQTASAMRIGLQKFVTALRQLLTHDVASEHVLPSTQSAHAETLFL
jgi:hypothetical protein